MKAAAPILNPLFLSIFIAIICLPSLAWLNNKGVSSLLAVFLVVGTLFVVVGALGIYVVSSVDVFSKQLPVYQKNLNQQAAILINWLSKHGLENI
jgi:predicted PurR-regulated permease PerM